ncbi:MAG: ABC transporter ATP-binding protein [Rhodospirillaceae bacterium]|nr:ABC transporter ATP-binding protein [Rhodospirillaceae bacterium]
MTTPGLQRPPTVEIRGLSKRFGELQALDDVSLRLEPGAFHALLGENGAGKSTFAKCLMGYYKPDSGSVEIDGVETPIANPRDAHAAGLGMVYQHFSLVPHMTVAENLVVARYDNPFVIDWKKEHRAIDEFLARTPFRVDAKRTAGSLAAGEKQKVEVLKQLYLNHRFIILDEPTSVLTPGEADELFGTLRAMCRERSLTVLLITHKFREVFEFAADVSVLRRGRLVAQGPVHDFDRERLAEVMVGSERIAKPVDRSPPMAGDIRLELRDLAADNDRGSPAVAGVSLSVRAGEILGVAGVSGNGQRELVELLAGQRDPTAGSIRVHGKPYGASRAEIRRHKFYLLPEEPLQNACARNMSVAENLAIRDFDRPPKALGGWLLDRGAIRREAIRLIERYNIRTRSPDAPVAELSGGNVQRTVLARELSHEVEVLIAANPCMGLDVGAISEIHGQLIAARNKGAAVLLVSEDLDELTTLADRLVVIFEGRIVYEAAAGAYDIRTIGRHMAGAGAAA